MSLIICRVSQAPLRVLPDHRKEMCSQFLFGETAEIIKEQADGWALVSCTWDGYEGWVRLNQFKKIPAQVPQKIMYQKASVEVEGKEHFLPTGSEIPCNINPGDEAALPPAGELSFLIPALTSLYMHVPYCWGGRSQFGIDCSGFVQVIFKLMEMSLPRDARQQIVVGEKVEQLAKATCGDLLFFDDPDGSVTHVGIFLSPGKIIHCSGEVRIDHLDVDGITHSETGKRTHHLCMIKRVSSAVINEFSSL
ncbi:MAG: C40 family peptidase [Ferruginibacter sp.]